MSQILKEYLILIILAALAIVALIWYSKKTVAEAKAALVEPIKKYKADVKTVTDASAKDWLQVGKELLFGNAGYISQADYKKNIEAINDQLFKKK